MLFMLIYKNIVKIFLSKYCLNLMLFRIVIIRNFDEIYWINKIMLIQYYFGELYMGGDRFKIRMKFFYEYLKSDSFDFYSYIKIIYIILERNIF